MAKIVEKLSILKMNKEERASYSYYQKQLHTDRDELLHAEARGEARGLVQGKAEGLQEGEAKQKMAIAKLLAQNIDPTIISAVTGLSPQQIEKLKSGKS